MRWTLAALLALSAFAEYPSARISNGIVNALIYLPDEQRGYYRGVRFDWAGIVPSLTFQGHEFFGQWFEHYDPLLHDAVMGPVEEFRSEDGPLRYADAKPNGLFLKIGVGELRKYIEEPYNFARSYALVNPGKRVVRVDSDRVEFEHDLNDGEGYAYVYEKTLLLPHRKAQLVLEHSLKNTGRLAIDTAVYDHDFFMLDHQPTGPDFRIRFPFAVKATDELKSPATVQGNEIRFSREMNGDDESAHGYVTGFSEALDNSEVRVENVKTRVGVRESIDKPVLKIYFWSKRSTVCPEIYIQIHVQPGKTFKWKTTYDFYTLR